MTGKTPLAGVRAAYSKLATHPGRILDRLRACYEDLMLVDREQLPTPLIPEWESLGSLCVVRWASARTVRR